MKKVFALLLSLTLCVGLLSACGGSKTETPASSGESGSSTATGSVYYLNFKPEQDEAWQNQSRPHTPSRPDISNPLLKPPAPQNKSTNV